MLGSWDAEDRAACSAWVDAYAAGAPRPDGPDDPWYGARHVYHLPHTDPDRANGYTAFAYDELHAGDVPSGLQTHAKWRALCARTTAESYAAVAWTHGPGEWDLVAGVAEGYADAPGSRLLLAPEFFLFGEHGTDGLDRMLGLVDAYQARGLLPDPSRPLGAQRNRVVPCVNVANSPHKRDLAYRAYSHDPGLVAWGWRSLLGAMRERGVADLWVWGAGYKRIGEPGGRGAAVAALDLVLASVFYG